MSRTKTKLTRNSTTTARTSQKPYSFSKSMSRNELFLVSNAINSRTELFRSMFDPRRDILKECGYPERVLPGDYRRMFDRFGMAAKVAKLMPSSSWAMRPEVYESEEGDDTEFETAWKALEKERSCFHYLQRADILSGIGHYGILLLGIDDGKDLSEPVDGITDDEAPGNFGSHKLLYLRPFDETQARIASWETKTNSPRCGFPKSYMVKFMDASAGEVISGLGVDFTEKKVHWTRVIHLCDNRGSSDVLGAPRMRDVWDRLLDLYKLLGGSAEMFWKGAFPGYSLEIDPEVMQEGFVFDDALEKKMRKQVDKFMNKLQRFMMTAGMKVKSLAPQVSDPTNHISVQLQQIAIALDVPLRKLLGTEEGKLAGDQDDSSWNRSVKNRQDFYVTAMIIRPFVKRLIAMGVLPSPSDLCVSWPDAHTPSDAEKADVALTKTDALTKYASGNGSNVVPEKEWLTLFLGFSTEEADVIIKAMTDKQKETEDVGDFDVDPTTGLPADVAGMPIASPFPADGTPTPPVAPTPPAIPTPTVKKKKTPPKK